MERSKPGETQADALVRTKFQQLASRWKKETAHHSSLAIKLDHTAFREIVGMGAQVVPLLLAELRRKPGFWFFALQKITEADPVPPGIEGDIAAICQAWVGWGVGEGLLE